MPRGHSLMRLHYIFHYMRFSGEKRTSMYISQEKGDHFYIQTQHNNLFFPLQSFSRKTLKKYTQKVCFNTDVSILDHSYSPSVGIP